MIATWEKAVGMTRISGYNFFCLPDCGHLKDGICRLSCGNTANACPIEKAPEVRALIARMGPVEGRADASSTGWGVRRGGAGMRSVVEECLTTETSNPCGDGGVAE